MFAVKTKADFPIDPVKISNIISTDPVALCGWVAVADELLTNPAIRLQIDSMFRRYEYIAAIRRTLNEWRSSGGVGGGTLGNLVAVFRRKGWNDLADKLEASDEILTELPSATGSSFFSFVPNIGPILEGRVKELDSLNRILESTSIDCTKSLVPRVRILSGVRGVGKTLLAMTYAKSPPCEASFPDGVVWLDFEKEITRLDYVKNVLEELKLEVANQFAGMKRELFKYFLNKRCLFIFDNVHSENLEDFWSFINSERISSGMTFLLITILRHGEYREDKQLTLDVMNVKEAKQWAMNCFSNHNIPASCEEVHRLVDTLSCFPLALAQAFAYICARTSGICINMDGMTPIEQYLQEFDESPQKLLEDTTFQSISPNTDPTLAAWSTTFKILSGLSNSSLALSILELISLLDDKAFNAHIFKELPVWFGKNFVVWVTKYFSTARLNVTELNESLQSLAKYCMINTPTTEPRSCYVHRLVQEVTKLKIFPKHLYWYEDVIKALQGEAAVLRRKKRYMRKVICVLIANAVLSTGTDNNNVQEFVDENYLRAESFAQQFCKYPELVKEESNFVPSVCTELLNQGHVDEGLSLLRASIPMYDKIFVLEKDRTLAMKYDFLKACLHHNRITEEPFVPGYIYFLCSIDPRGYLIWVLEMCEICPGSEQLVNLLQLSESTYYEVSPRCALVLECITRVSFRLFTVAVNQSKESLALEVIENLKTNAHELLKCPCFYAFVLEICSRCKALVPDFLLKSISTLSAILPFFITTSGENARSTLQLKYELIRQLVSAGRQHEAFRCWVEFYEAVSPINWSTASHSQQELKWLSLSVKEFSVLLFDNQLHKFLQEQDQNHNVSSLASWNPTLIALGGNVELENTIWGLALLTDQWELMMDRNSSNPAKETVAKIEQILRRCPKLRHDLKAMSREDAAKYWTSRSVKLLYKCLKNILAEDAHT